MGHERLVLSTDAAQFLDAGAAVERGQDWLVQGRDTGLEIDIDYFLPQ